MAWLDFCVFLAGLRFTRKPVLVAHDTFRFTRLSSLSVHDTFRFTRLTSLFGLRAKKNWTFGRPQHRIRGANSKRNWTELAASPDLVLERIKMLPPVYVEEKLASWWPLHLSSSDQLFKSLLFLMPSCEQANLHIIREHSPTIEFNLTGGVPHRFDI